MGDQPLNKTVAWKSSYISTTEFTTIRTEKDIDVRGQITGEEFGKLYNIHYHLKINLNWVIQSFSADSLSELPFSVSFHKNKKGEWVDKKGKVLPEFEGCTDVDIMLTPFTNTLPVNRLNLPVGVSEEIKVVYIDLKQNICSPANQRYTNMGNGTYKYESLPSGFTALLKVDEDGLVIDYPGIWHRVNPVLRGKDLSTGS
jgi:hypothetical protein